jgi:hypothetical protein
MTIRHLTGSGIRTSGDRPLRIAAPVGGGDDDDREDRTFDSSSRDFREF